MGCSSEVRDRGHGSEVSAHAQTLDRPSRQRERFPPARCPGRRWEAMTETVTRPAETDDVVLAMQDRLRAMHVTLLFIAVLLCVMLGLNLILLTAD